MNEINYQLRRSSRRTISIEITPGGGVLVRAPQRASQADIERMLARHAGWIEQKRREQALRQAAWPEPDAAQEQALRARARAEIPPLVDCWAARMGVAVTGVKITSARTRFGSCSARNALCFSWRLMQHPPEAVEAVVVHELAHVRHKNHGPAFYAEVERFLPDYRQRIRGLRIPEEESKT